jgi:uncharacterized protein involved in outer membrane biogenesis
MKKSLRIAAILLVVIFLLVIGSGLAVKTMLSGAQIQTLLTSLEQRTGAKISAKGGDLDLKSWIMLRPAISVQEFAIANPPGFSTEPLITAREVSTQVSLWPLLSKRIEVKKFALVEPQVRIEHNRSGRSNVELLLEASTQPHVTANTTDTSGQGSGFSVGEFRITNGALKYFEAGHNAPSLAVRDVDLVISDFADDRSASLKLEAKLFSGKTSRLEFKGKAGPFRSTMPASGDLTLTLAPAEIPKPLRDELLGDMLRDPGDSARATLEASISGDLMAALQGKGKLKLEKIMLGRNNVDRVSLAGDAPLRVSISKPLADPAITLDVNDATLQLGQGKWKGRAEVELAGPRMRGSSSGSITGVQVNEMLSAFTTAKGKVSGLASMPEYRVSFAGRNASELRESLTGQGVVSLENGRFAILDVFDVVRKVANQILKGEQDAPAGETAFQKFRSSFQIREGRVHMPDIALDGIARLDGQGFFTLAQELNFDLRTAVSGRDVPLKLRGTLSSPKIYPDVGRIATQQVTEKAVGLLDKFLNKKK